VRPTVLLICAAMVGALPALSGCASAVQAGHNTALDGVDLVRMTDDMSMKIVADPDVQAAIRQSGKLKVVVQPVENRMTAEVLPKGPAEAFTARVRALLSNHAPDRFTWVMNRDTFYDLRGRSSTSISAPRPMRSTPNTPSPPSSAPSPTRPRAAAAATTSAPTS